MLDYERQQRILELLRTEGSMTTAALAAKLFVSEATVRRDLSRLEGTGQLRRIHGGAMLLSGPEYELPLSLRDRQSGEAKQNIAAKAARLISDGQTIMLDASSTVLRLVPHLAQKSGLTVVTNGPKTTIELAARHVKTLSTGGIVLENSVAFVGRQAEQFIAGINADILFFSCRGLTGDGWVTDSSLEEACIRREMLRRAKHRWLLCDTNKLGAQYTYNICHVDELDGVISEQ
ncbi:MAG: DeoR/GlpR transcriptional regulator [Clostridia bacterium]|nr:DeoR/GlpR transcriptional regulator [Clostridia bacterium]